MKLSLPLHHEAPPAQTGKHDAVVLQDNHLETTAVKPWRRGSFVSRSFVVLCVIFFAGIALWYVGASPVHPGSNEQIRFIVQKGETSFEIARNLKSQELIRSSLLFRAHVVLLKKARHLKAGWYLLSPRMDMNEIVAKFVAGDTVQEQLVAPEGWTLRDIAKALEAKGLFTQEEFFQVAGIPAFDYREHPELPWPFDFSLEFAFLEKKPSFIGIEGFLFPDTYQISLGESPEDIVRRMLGNFEKHVHGALISKIEKQEKSLFEIVIMASLLEKEVRSLADKKIVAGILWKRLRHGIPLQVDAMVVYIKGGNSTGVSIEDTQSASPYNTYKNRGLPLGPISNPGIESILAALEPEESPYWFYLSTRDGTTVFSRNFEEHKAAKARYLQNP